ncbi:ABC transporter substrate-binding protein [Streptomonospora litoralis]|uniref:Corrinoid ABC transporter substrate-binding protein n=1 Tax=Streptomonospora litoralis TaxID=2498135 RepID=A0A4P6Q641_9ACTN|nr:ABC transporter substrate-binding protein [Streptomonospora litoralis]QBI56226.1 corrinoid ABC transporter substrate-binding protein [Streptomonospora litoralis]
MARVSARPSPAAFALVGAFLLAGCGAPAPEQSAAGGGVGVTRTNCGIDVTVDGPPERLYAAYQPGIEMAHALGLGDRLVGTAFLDAEVLPEYADEQAEADYVPSLPSREGLLEAQPDFVLSGYPNVFSENSGNGSVGTRASLRELGVQSWVMSALCPSEDGLTDRAIDPASVTVDSVYKDLRGLGALFGAEDRAEEVISGMKERIATVDKQVEGVERPTVAIVSPGEDGGYRVASGLDFGTRIIERAGGTNVFEDLKDKRNIEVGVEELVERDPDVILTDLCCDAELTREDARSEVDAITSDAALSGVTAVAEGEVHPFLFADRAAGVRAANSIELVASHLHPDLVEQ